MYKNEYTKKGDYDHFRSFVGNEHSVFFARDLGFDCRRNKQTWVCRVRWLRNFRKIMLAKCFYNMYIWLSFITGKTMIVSILKHR